jgi:type III restriction enzyme
VDEKKRQAAIRWVNAVNNDGRYGRWAYDMITDPSDVPATLKRIVESLDITSNPKDANKHVAIRN